jgi:hypothetical protein
MVVGLPVAIVAGIPDMQAIEIVPMNPGFGCSTKVNTAVSPGSTETVVPFPPLGVVGTVKVNPAAVEAPVPLSETVCGLPAALSVICTLADSLPVADGVNVMVIVQDAPAARVTVAVGQLFDCWKSAAFAPATEMAVIVSVAVPEFVSVTDAAALGVPTFTAPKETLAGDNVTAGAVPVPLTVSVRLPASVAMVIVSLRDPGAVVASGAKVRSIVQAPPGPTATGNPLRHAPAAEKSVALETPLMCTGPVPVFVSVTAAVMLCDCPIRTGFGNVNGFGFNCTTPPGAAVPVSVKVTFVVPSVCAMSVSLSGVPVGVLAVGANVIVMVHVPPSWITTTVAAPKHVPDALKSGELVVFVPVNAIGPSPVLVNVIGADCVVVPTATGVGKLTAAAAGDAVPGGAAMDCTTVSSG